MSDDIIVAASLRKEYLDVLAVDDIDLSLSAGAMFGLIGPNGAGKTTLLRMFATAMEPTAGTIRFNGVDIWAAPVAVRSQIGFMPDFFQLYEKLTVLEFLTYFGVAHGMNETDAAVRAGEVIELIGLGDKRKTYCKGLSRGMVQRVGLGRAILHNPRLLLLDEPASGLDPLARKQLFDILRRVNANGTTVLISSHILDELSGLCTSVGIMHNGRFLEAGPTEQIIRKIMPHRRMTLRVVGDASAAAKIAAGQGGVSDIAAEGSAVRFAFEGDDAALAAVTSALVHGGVGVAALEEARSSLNEVYYAIAERNGHAATE